jgi:hypothetical protein
VSPEQVVGEFERYESELSRIHDAFKRTREGYYIADGDDQLYRQYVQELMDLYNDSLGKNSYTSQVAQEFQSGFGHLGTPSLKGVENVLCVVRASLTRFRRNPELLIRTKAQESLLQRQNVFLIHGHDEAKWRELKDIIQSEFRLNPIVLTLQPDVGANHHRKIRILCRNLCIRYRGVHTRRRG